MRPQVGQVINNKYRLLRLIGDGGMGSVYEARHEVLGTSVALKFLHTELSRRPGLVQRFLQEARVSAQIQSPHVVRVTDVDQAAAGAYIVMEYLEGKTLQTLYEDLYKAGQQLSYGDALSYAMQMLEGVEAAHKQGIVHRDLKPDNVMITMDGKGRPLIKLLDFGIAKLKVSGEYDRGLTRPGVIMGTPEYMAPEQAFSADAVDARADIFSLGVMIFEMLAGRRPVGGDEPQQIAAAYLSGRIAHLNELAPNISPDLAAAVHRAMAPMAKDRWQSVSDLRDAIEPFAPAPIHALSALPPRVSLSNPDLSNPPQSPAAVTPPATNVGGEAAAAGSAPVPKTLPPGSMAAPGAATPLPGDATSPADPPEMSNPGQPPRDPTPLGGFRPSGAAAVAPYVVPPTKSAAPYVPEAAAVDPAATAFASPLAPLADAAIDLPQRASGTAIGDAVFPGTAPVDPAFGGAFAGPPVVPAAPIAPPVMPAAPRGRQKPNKGILSSLPGILLLAAGIAGLVVGGLYIAQKSSKADDKDDPAPAPPTAATVRSDPPPSDPPPTTAAQPPVTPPPVTPPPSKPPQQLPPRKTPPPKGSGTPSQPSPPPANSGRVLPPIPIIVVPSTFPLSFPLFGPDQPQPQQPRTQPDAPPRGQRDAPPPGQRRPPPQRDEPPGQEPPTRSRGYGDPL
jgi:serine/threonine-protein kinase